jgi:NADH:ubiquinone oxidoreductase 49 kD subunit 7
MTDGALMDGPTRRLLEGEQRIATQHQLRAAAAAAHGVLRLVLELDGEVVERVDPHIGCSIAAPRS